MEAIVHQPLCHVLGADAAAFLEMAQIEDAFVRHAARGPLVEHREVRRQARRDVVGIDDGELGGAADAARAHHADVHPRDQQDERTPIRSGRYSAVAVERVRGQIRREMGGHRDGSHARPAAAVRDAEGLVQVDVADVGADQRRLRQPGERVHVGAVHVDLAARRVHQLADARDAFLEHAVRRRVGHHQHGEALAVLGHLALEVAEIDVAVLVAAHDHDAKAHHLRTRRVGAVRRGRNQADVARLTFPFVVRTDGEQPRIFALGAGVGLQRYAREAGNLGEHVFQLGEHRPCAVRLLVRRERVQRRELRP